jgi:hypothetical protein
MPEPFSCSWRPSEEVRSHRVLNNLRRHWRDRRKTLLMIDWTSSEAGGSDAISLSRFAASLMPAGQRPKGV